jgi:hypothetical protein
MANILQIVLEIDPKLDKTQYNNKVVLAWLEVTIE